MGTTIVPKCVEYSSFGVSITVEGGGSPRKVSNRTEKGSTEGFHFLALNHVVLDLSNFSENRSSSNEVEREEEDAWTQGRREKLAG